MATLLDDSLVIVLAGGVGERLHPLTKERAKPAVYFGGPYRIIDFALSNCINSGLRRIFIATQYKSLSLNRHIRMGWNIVSEELGEFVEILPPQKRVSEHWYQGTADAVYQNLYSIIRENPRFLIVLSGDHVYKMDYSRMLRSHQERRAAVTLAAIEVPIDDGSRFGIVAINEDERVTGFQEKPKQASPIPGSPEFALASMGVYIFDTDVLVRALEADAGQATNHDFGKDIIPALIHQAPVYAYRFYDENKKASKYWRDIGTLDAYFEADVSAAGAAREVRLCGGGSPLRPGARLGDLAGLHRLRQRDFGQRPLSERARAQLLRHRPVHPDARRPRRPSCKDPSRDHRPRRADSARRPDRLQPRRGSQAPYGVRRGRRGRHDRRRAADRPAVGGRAPLRGRGRSARQRRLETLNRKPTS
jgi:glucose-1-phosphate adenylyltransferase